VKPLVRGPSEEVLALARALIAEPSTAPRSPDSLLDAAVRRVFEELDAYDRELFDRVRREPAAAPSRRGVELAIGQRIVEKALEAAGHIADLTDRVGRPEAGG
jgi:hypothetical protein